MKDKRVIRRPWGRKKGKGFVIQVNDLRDALKGGQVAEFGKISVGAKQLDELIKLMAFSDEEILVNCNGVLEVSNIKRVRIYKNGAYMTSFRSPKLAHSFRLNDQAWGNKPKSPVITLVIKPRKF